jgi:recombination protein RecA
VAKNALADLAAMVSTNVGTSPSAGMSVGGVSVSNSSIETVSSKVVKEKESKNSSVLNTKEDKFAALKAVEKALNKQFDTTLSIVRLGDRVGIDVPSISTELPTLDYNVLGCGGIPRGRIIEVLGPESSGKTTLALHLIAMEQKNTENLCAIVDAEHAIDVNYAAKLGVNVDELLISQPSSGEEALEIVEALIDSSAVSLIVVDSVAALTPRAELDGEMGQANMGLQARLMSQACRKLVGKAAMRGVTVLFINQIRMKIAVMYGSPETTTGGVALKFYASVRLDVRRKDVIGPKEQPIGHVLKIKAIKNKCGCPMRETLVNLLYESGIDTFGDFVNYAVSLGAIHQSGAWYDFKGERLGQGLTNTAECVRLNKELQTAIKDDVARIRAAQKEGK